MTDGPPTAPSNLVVKAATTTTARVAVVAPPRTRQVTVTFKPAGGGEAITATKNNKKDETACGTLTIGGLNNAETYTCSAVASNAAGSSPSGPAVKFRILDAAPVPPCAPVCESAEETCARLLFTVPKSTDNVALWLWVVDGKPQRIRFGVDSRSNNKLVDDLGCAIHVNTTVKSVVVTGLEPATKYEVKLCARNECGWSRYGPPAMFKTDDADEIVITGVVTQEERDEQNFKTAIVIADDTDEDLGDAAGGKEEAKEEAALEHAAATAAEEEKHVEAKDEEDDRAGGTISSLLAAVLGR